MTDQIGAALWVWVRVRVCRGRKTRRLRLQAELKDDHVQKPESRVNEPEPARMNRRPSEQLKNGGSRKGGPLRYLPKRSKAPILIGADAFVPDAGRRISRKAARGGSGRASRSRVAGDTWRRFGRQRRPQRSAGRRPPLISSRGRLGTEQYSAAAF